MKNKFLEKKNISLFFAGLICILVFSFRFFLQKDFLQIDFLKVLIFYLGAFFLLPLGVIIFFYHQKISDFFWKGWRIEDFKNKKVFIGLFFCWIGIFLLIMLKFDKWREFPASPWVLGKWDLVLFLDLTFLPLILFFQEFFFRGFLLKIFSDKLKNFWAISFQAMLAISIETLFSGRTFLSIFLLFIFYYLLGWVSLKNKNFLFSWWMIFLNSLIFDLLVHYKISALLLNN